MSFRTRLTSFFVLIVVVPMLAVGLLVFRLISDSEQGKADARASGLASAAANTYAGEVASAHLDIAACSPQGRAAAPRHHQRRRHCRLGRELRISGVLFGQLRPELPGSSRSDRARA